MDIALRHKVTVIGQDIRLDGHGLFSGARRVAVGVLYWHWSKM